MSVIIGSARMGENGKITGGAAGDQKQPAYGDDYSGEVSIQPFYVHNKGWYVLRPKDPNTAEKIAQLMLDACNNKNIGYNQNDRYGVIKNGVYTLSKTNCDCSSLVRECVKEATKKDPGDFNTASEVSVLQKTGLFMTTMSYNSNVQLYNGDILVTKSKGHTVIVVRGKKRVESTNKDTVASNGEHVQINYTVGRSYAVSNCSELNIRTKTSKDGLEQLSINKPIGTKKKGDRVFCQAAGRVDNKIYVYFGLDKQGREQWLCADNGKVAYLL